MLAFEPDDNMLRKASNLQKTIRSLAINKEDAPIKEYKGKVIDDALIQKCLAAEQS